MKGSLTKLRTESKIGLGDSEKRVLKLLGHPTQRDKFKGYSILWYVQKPKHVVKWEEGFKHEWEEGRAAAYALKKGAVVEIWLQEWDTQAGG